MNKKILFLLILIMLITSCGIKPIHNIQDNVAYSYADELKTFIENGSHAAILTDLDGDGMDEVVAIKETGEAVTLAIFDIKNKETVYRSWSNDEAYSTNFYVAGSQNKKYISRFVYGNNDEDGHYIIETEIYEYNNSIINMCDNFAEYDFYDHAEIGMTSDYYHNGVKVSEKRFMEYIGNYGIYNNSDGKALGWFSTEVFPDNLFDDTEKILQMF